MLESVYAAPGVKYGDRGQCDMEPEEPSVTSFLLYYSDRGVKPERFGDETGVSLRSMTHFNNAIFLSGHLAVQSPTCICHVVGAGVRPKCRRQAKVFYCKPGRVITQQTTAW